MAITKYGNVEKIILIFYITKLCLYVKGKELYYSFFSFILKREDYL
jgi:hypothetical protein